MHEDAVMRELRAVRAAYAKSLGYDLRKIVADLQQQDRDEVKPKLSKPARKKTSSRIKPSGQAAKPSRRRPAA